MAFDESLPTSASERKAHEDYERRRGGTAVVLAGDKTKKEKPDKFEAVVSRDKVKTKKTGVGRKLRDIFIANDPIDVINDVFDRIFVPSIQDLLLDMAWGGLNMLFHEGGSVRPRRGRRSGSYHDMYDDRRESRVSRVGDSERSERHSRGRSIDDLEFESRVEAERVLEKCLDILEEYEAISIGDVLDLCDQDHAYTDEDYGWSDLSKARVERLGRDYYTIYFPKAKRLR